MKFNKINIRFYRMNEVLSNANEQLQYKQRFSRHTNMPDNAGSSETLNSNGKRQMVPAEQYGYRNGKPISGSSPRSALTPLGPTRLTLPPGQTVQELSSYAPSSHNDTGLHPNHGSDRIQMHSSNGAQLRRPSSTLME
jgi:hypothetical protein